MNEPAPTRARTLTREQAIRRVGSHPAFRVVITMLFSVLISAMVFYIDSAMQGLTFRAIERLVIGCVVGFVPLGVIMGMLVIRVHAVHAMFWCFGSAVFVCVLALGLLGYEFALVGAGFGWVLGVIVTLRFAPRQRIYRYGRCPGCDYNLAMLPKSDVCPECGRDNRDLVEIFADLHIEKARP